MPAENDAIREASGPGGRAARYVIPFDEASKDDCAVIGGKCTGLVALIAAGAVVPTGFVVTTNAYADALAHDLHDVIARLTDGLTVDDVPRSGARGAGNPRPDHGTADTRARGRSCLCWLSCALRASRPRIAGRRALVRHGRGLARSELRRTGRDFFMDGRRRRSNRARAGLLGKPVYRARHRLPRQERLWARRAPDGRRSSADGERACRGRCHEP